MNSKGREEKQQFLLEKNYTSEHAAKCCHRAAVALIYIMNLALIITNATIFIMGCHRSSAVGKIKTEFMRGPGRCDTSRHNDFNETWLKWRTHKATLLCVPLSGLPFRFPCKGCTHFLLGCQNVPSSARCAGHIGNFTNQNAVQFWNTETDKGPGRERRLEHGKNKATDENAITARQPFNILPPLHFRTFL